MVDTIKRRAEIEQPEQRHLLLIHGSKYVRQYLDKCCLSAVVASVGRLQAWHHAMLAEVADELTGHGPFCQLGDSDKLETANSSSARRRLVEIS